MARQFDGAGNQDLVAALLEAGGDRLDAAARVAQALCKAEEADLGSAHFIAPGPGYVLHRASCRNGRRSRPLHCRSSCNPGIESDALWRA